MSRKRLRASGWSSAAPRVVGERAVESDYLDARPARTWVPRRVNWRVPDGPWPCEVCGQFLEPGTRAHRSVRRGEAFYRHRACSGAAS